jgi:hypothetical protein
VGLGRAAAASRRDRQGLEVLLEVDDRGQAVREEEIVGVAVGAIEHQDRLRDARLPELDALLDQCHAKPVDPGGLQGGSDHLRAVTVGIGLDDRPDRDARTGQVAHDGEVVPQRVEVDLEPRRARQAWQAGGGQAVLDRWPRRGRGH